VFAQEDERRRIAREMHDQFGEQLTALGRRIALLKDACSSHPDSCEHVEALESIAHRLDSDVDHLVWELRPTALDDLGLRAALTNYVQDWSKRVGISAHLHTSGLWDNRLQSDAETTLYRIAQEALTNAVRHSRARRITIRASTVRSIGLRLSVADDGRGIAGDRRAAGFGMTSMQERAERIGASLTIVTAPRNGTEVVLAWEPTALPTQVHVAN
jgi:signal transduction histidine kinase